MVSSIPHDNLRELAGHFELVTAKKGIRIFKQGDPGDSMYIIKSGTVGVYFTGEKDEYLINISHRGEFFGELALITGKPRAASIRVILDAKLYRLGSDAFEKLFQQNSDIRNFLIRIEKVDF